VSVDERFGSDGAWSSKCEEMRLIRIPTHVQARFHLPDNARCSRFHRILGPWSLSYICAVRNLPRLGSSLRRGREPLSKCCFQKEVINSQVSFLVGFKLQHETSAPMLIAHDCGRFPKSDFSRVNIRHKTKKAVF